VKPDTTGLPPAKPKGRTAHARHLESHFPAGLWQIETDECCKEKAWSKNYTVGFPKHKVDMLPKGDLDHGPLKLRTVHFGDITIIYESKVSEQNIFPWLKGTIES
jgi:hypothetical protein